MDEKICFVISPIGDPDSETRKRSDQALRYVISPALDQRQYSVIRADDIAKPGIITNQIIEHIVSDQLVLADLSDRNPNVFYELAIRHAIRKPLVQIMRRGEVLPFDVHSTRTIYYDLTDLDSVHDAVEEIAKQITALDEDPSDVESPISMALDLQKMRASGKPEDRSMADLLSGMAEVRAQLAEITGMIGNSDREDLIEDLSKGIAAISRQLRDDDHREDTPFVHRGHLSLSTFRYLLNSAPRRSAATSILIVASIFRDWVPWIHELGLECARTTRSGDYSSFQNAFRELRDQISYVFHGPQSHEFLGEGGRFDDLKRELENILDDAASMAQTELSLHSTEYGEVDHGK